MPLVCPSRPLLLGLAGLLTILALAVPLVAQSGGGTLVFIGTYASPASKGIYVSRLDASTGALSTPTLAAEIRNPSFVAASADGRFLYAVSEVDAVAGKPGGGVAAYAIDKAAGTLKPLNTQSTVGGGPAHVSVAGTMVFAANYGGGSVVAYRTQPDGSLQPPSSFVQHKGSSVNPDRQKGPHAHSINTDPANHYALTADLGLDKVLVYKIDAKSTLMPNDPASVSLPGGSGPRHLDFSPNGRFAYLASEMKSNVTVFSWDATHGTLKEEQTISMLPEGFTGNSSAADIHVHPSGKFVYASNRGHDSIVIYAADPQTGKLTLVGHQSTEGKTPRNFGIDPSGSYLLAANQATDTVVAFKIDKTSGKLTPTGSTAHIAAPVCVKFFARK